MHDCYAARFAIYTEFIDVIIIIIMETCIFLFAENKYIEIEA